VIGADPARRRVAELAGASDARIAWWESLPCETAAQAEKRIALSIPEDWLLLLAERTLLHPRAIEWYASVIGRGAATAFVADEETGTRERGSIRRTSPELRQVVDYDTLLEINTFGETIAVEHATYIRVVNRLATSSVSSARSSLLLTLSCDGRVGHIPCPLVRRDGPTPFNQVQPREAHEDAVRAHLAEADLGGRILIDHEVGPLPRLRILWRAQTPDEPIAIIIYYSDPRQWSGCQALRRELESESDGTGHSPHCHR
jgi:hypothetical protein